MSLLDPSKEIKTNKDSQQITEVDDKQVPVINTNSLVELVNRNQNRLLAYNNHLDLIEDLIFDKDVINSLPIDQIIAIYNSLNNSRTSSQNFIIKLIDTGLALEIFKQKTNELSKTLNSKKENMDDHTSEVIKRVIAKIAGKAANND